MEYSYWERYKLLRHHYPHHLWISSLIHARTMRNEADWTHMDYDKMYKGH